MATDFKLAQDQDLVIEDGDIALVSDGEEVVQNAKIRILTILGEWVYDYTIGVDWFGTMFSTSSSKFEKEVEIRQAILGTPGVRRLLRFQFDIDPIERAALIEFTVDTDYGEISTELTI